MTDETNTNEQQATPEQAPIPQSENLLDNADTQTADATTDATEQADGERPTWLPEKFKTPEDFAKSYSELEKKIGTQPKAPDEYDYGFVKEMGLEMSEAQQKEANEVFRSYGLTQEQMKGMMALYSDSVQQLQQSMQGVQVDTAREQQQIKDVWANNYEQRIEATRNFAKNLNKDTLAAPLASTAEGLQILYDAMQYRNGPNPMQGNAQTSAVTRTQLLEKVKTMRDDAKYQLPQGDPVGDAHRNEIYRLYQMMEKMPADNG